MESTTNNVKPPLWRVMWDAFQRASDRSVPGLYAAIIRAFADWLVPVAEPPADPTNSYAWGMWEKEIALRSRLLAEADRAEVGE